MKENMIILNIFNYLEKCFDGEKSPRTEKESL